jgi:hypothetical protein
MEDHHFNCTTNHTIEIKTILHKNKNKRIKETKKDGKETFSSIFGFYLFFFLMKKVPLIH